MAAGFIAFEITWRADVFSGAPQESSAASYGTLGITFRARKPYDEQEWLDAAGVASSCSVAPATSMSWSGMDRPTARPHGTS